MRAREFSPYLIFAGLVWVPLMILPYDMFDGAIIQYASQVDDCSGLKIWFLEANYYLEYPLHCAIISVAKMLQMPYLTINGIFILLVGSCLLREVSLFSKVELKLSGFSALVAPLLVSAAPVWSTLVASVLTFYFFCLTLGLLSVRLIHERRAFATTIGFLLLGASFQYTSLLVFLPVLSYAYDVLRKTPENGNFPLPGWRTSCIFGVAVISYVVFRLLLNPSGVYEGYNNFEFPATLGEIMGFVNHGMRLTTFGLPLVIIVGLLAIAFAAFGRPGDNTDALIGRRALPILFIVCIAAAIPYVVVGKSTTLISIWGWNARHGFLLAVATAFFTGVLLHCLG